jgi:hypothetical protein
MLSRGRHLVIFAVALLLAFGFAPLAAHAQQTMDNDAVVKLVKSGLGEDLIVQTITASAGHYDISTDAMIALKQAGVTDKELGAMITKNTAPAQTAAPATQTIVIAAPAGPKLPDGVDEVGVYFQDKAGAWSTVYAENVNFKTGGILKSIATDGIIKPDLNGHLTGPASKLKINLPASFMIYVIEGQSPGEYQLLHLHTHPDGREFRSMTGGVVHQSSGAERDTVDFDTKKIAPRVYQVVLPAHLAPGEYGFLPPGTMNSGKNLASSGKMYTFTITE